MRPVFHKHCDDESRVVLVSSGLAAQGRLPPKSVFADVKANFNNDDGTLQTKTRRYLAQGRTRKNQAELFVDDMSADELSR